RLFRENGITGKGIRIAVFDGGFPEVNKHPAFEHIRSDGRIIATFDFTKDKEFSYRGSSHGLSTLSNIGGKYGSLLIGLAPEAEYLLAVTEVNREIFKEEVWWVAAAEWADKNGAQIINSSLGYTEPRYAPSQMDGRYTMISRAANIAVSKGILVINAAGNEGMTPSWQIIGAPADADSVLSVGGVNPNSGLKINFSSFGPNASRKLKPNVAASGTTVAARPLGRFGKVDGTSFASPLVAGFAACVMQLRPGLKAMEYFDLIQKSAHLYPYFDYAHGFGIPQADYFFQARTEISKTFTAVYNRLHSDNTVQNMDLLLQDQPIPPGQESILISLMTEHTNDSEFPAFDYFYYHFANEKNELVHYEVVIPVRTFSVPVPDAGASVFRAFYKGHYVEVILK
ncbi:MAG: S8 family serine peptidase, partial [Thermaurantimonas sp.]